MLDLNTLRDQFATYLQDPKGQAQSMDGALMHVCRLAYEKGLADGRSEHGEPPLREAEWAKAGRGSGPTK